jgi:hypothetical protein
VVNFIDRLPWLSSSLLLITYANFGWVLVQINAPHWAWVAGTGLTLLIAEALASPWSFIRYVFSRWISTDEMTFIAAMAGTLFTVICLTWVHVSAHGVLLVTASAIVRLDAQRFGMKEWQAFLLLTFVSFSGLGLGWFSHLYH